MNTARTVRLSRRAALLGGLGLGAGLLTGCQGEAPKTDPGSDLMLTKPPTSTAQPVTTVRNLSVGRYRDVDLVIIRPAGLPPGPIPVCVALPTKIGGARSLIELKVPDMLTELVRYTSSPFAVVAADGGNWVGNKDDEPLRMLEEDMPNWLEYHDLASTPFAAIGIGEGGAGALNYVRAQGIAAVAAISPTLYEDWPSALSSRDYENRAQWEASEPLRHTAEYSNLAVGIWCGANDSGFLAPAKEFAQEVGAAEAKWAPGRHDGAYWRTALPEALKFVGSHL